MQINAPRIDDKPQLNLARLDDKLHLNGPLREEQLPGSPTRSRFIGVEVNGVSQNGPQTLNHDSVPHENGSDTLRSLDSVPWNLDGTQTIIENGSRAGVKNGSALAEENGQESHISLEEELKQHREENKRLKAALSEVSCPGPSWRKIWNSTSFRYQIQSSIFYLIYNPHFPIKIKITLSRFDPVSLSRQPK